jgi:hypothetical protein
VAYVDRIDLTAPGVGFFTTPHSGPLDTIAQTTSQFLQSSGVQVAINANFFAPCCNRARVSFVAFPYSSERSFTTELRNWSTKYPLAR